ncbi:MAG: P63C domain-containing protein [Planctomycetota bacterium]
MSKHNLEFSNEVLACACSSGYPAGMETTEFGSPEAASKGGKARSASMTPERRKEIAQLGAEAKWEKAGTTPPPKATHEGDLHIGAMEIPCAVLEGGRRVLTQSGFMVLLGRARQAKGRQHYSGDVNLPAFLTAKNLKPFIGNDLAVTSSQIEFRTLKGKRAFGYPAEILPQVLGVFLDAKAAGQLDHTQEHIADKALILIRALAATGIAALVDEATGYQYARPRRDLEEYLSKFLAESLRKWVRTFPADYFKHLCRLRGVELRADMRLPLYFGGLTNDLIYRRIAPGLLAKLKDRRTERGDPRDKLFSWLSQDVGLRELLVHLGVVVGLMKCHTSFAAFKAQLDQIAPLYPKSPGLFDNAADWEAKD